MADTFSITMDLELKEELRGIEKSGKHGKYRSTVISYYIRRGLELEKLIGNNLEFLIASLKSVEKELAEIIKSGRHGSNLGEVISYYVKQGIELDKHGKDGLGFMIDFFKALEREPALIPKFREFLEQTK